ncbi:MAG: hypothetical protein AAF409_19350 [Pseudomonadota bacterium]
MQETDLPKKCAQIGGAGSALMRQPCNAIIDRTSFLCMIEEQ